MKPLFNRRLTGIWSSGGNSYITHTLPNEDATVEIQDPAFPESIYTHAGCQRGYMHYTLAAQFGAALLEAAATAAKLAGHTLPQPFLTITAKGKQVMRRNVDRIEHMGSKVIIFYKDGSSEDIRPNYTLGIRTTSMDELLGDGLTRLAEVIPAFAIFSKGGDLEDAPAETP